ncbi:amino acid ABC transporter permease [Vallicoccus soli]|uniref:Amino acid ABC transporter permease n=1 Tax=Vallicoccus soli TaxID=2339232 RepID=A0A3A3Z016_9ACTN|nr:amino acid ABC transporter permease [Vallicoccus soli]RJK96473.1 amino acid ABC transporter permease [Vallicoccus soli]
MSTSTLYDVAGPRTRRRILVGSLVGTALLAVLVALAVQRLAANDQFDPELYEPFFQEPQLYDRLLTGILGTLEAAGYALVLALVLGTVLAAGRLSSTPLLRVPSRLVVEFFRGVPLLLLIFFFYLGFPRAFGINLPSLWALVFGLTLYNGAVIAEIIRAGVLSLPRGQREAGVAIGMSDGQVMRTILLPQAFRTMLPALISQLVVLLKDTSLGFIIVYGELLRIGQQLIQFFDNPVQMSVVLAAIYITINALLSRLATYVEGRQRRGRGGGPSAAAPAPAPGGDRAPSTVGLGPGPGQG